MIKSYFVYKPKLFYQKKKFLCSHIDNKELSVFLYAVILHLKCKRLEKKKIMIWSINHVSIFQKERNKCN